VVALMYVMLLLGMVGSALVFGCCWPTSADPKLIQVVQGAAVVTMVLNVVALWKQEARNPRAAAAAEPDPVSRCLGAFAAGGRAAASCWWRWAWAPPPSACRTSCWNPTAARS
jgi:BCD family chlorophyll transporter-like MFS transporter